MVTKKEDEHDKAMFGPKWRDTAKKYSDEKKGIITNVEVDKEIPLANARVIFSELHICFSLSNESLIRRMNALD